MYRNTNDGQPSIYDFILPFGGHLKEDNRYLHRQISFDAYNEGKSSDVDCVVEMYRSRFGNYSERILAGIIYRGKNTRTFCKSHYFHLSVSKLGTPEKPYGGNAQEATGAQGT